MKHTSRMLCLPLLTLAAAAYGCSTGSEQPAGAASSGGEVSEAPQSASAALQAAPGVALSGHGEFTTESNGVRARVQIKDATPGLHGIHIHEKGDCSDIRGKSMGSHFAPDAKEHGLLQSPVRHLGDLGNIEVAADGTGELDVIVPNATLDGGGRSYVGKALVIHEKEDVGTGPSGESGDPVACAKIEAKGSE